MRSQERVAPGTFGVDATDDLDIAIGMDVRGALHRTRQTAGSTRATFEGARGFHAEFATAQEAHLEGGTEAAPMPAAGTKDAIV